MRAASLPAGNVVRRPDPPAAYRWRPGQSGNPSGRNGATHVVNQAIRQLTDDGTKLVNFWVHLACGELVDVRTGALQRKLAPRDVRYVVRAVEWLSDRLLGRAPLVIKSNSSHFEEIRITYQEMVRDLPVEERLVLAKAIATMRANQQAALKRRAIELETLPEAMAENGNCRPLAAGKSEFQR
jgi:hypothetical protein